MENREAFTGISVETEESVEEVKVGDSTTTIKEEEVIIEVTIEVTTIKQTTVLEGEVTKMVIIVVIAIQDNRQVTAVQYVRYVTPQMFSAYNVD